MAEPTSQTELDRRRQQAVKAIHDYREAVPRRSSGPTLSAATARYISFLDPERDADLIAAAKAKEAQSPQEQNEQDGHRALARSLWRVLGNHQLQ